jgi:hypothetical protein
MLIPTIERQDMDSAAIVHRAQEAGVQIETYDPAQLVQDIAELLRARGLHPDMPSGTGRAGTATGASGQLLRAFGILPAADWRVRDRVEAPDPESR